jgi:DNA end-binding protein Ku
LPEENEEDQSSVRSFWSGTITFGLVSIPVELFPANRASRAGLRSLAPDGTPLRRRYYSAASDKELEPKAMVRGYETENGKYVVVTDDELERLAPDKSRDIDLRKFVKLNAIHPLYFERGYFLAPGAGSTKAYQLLAAVMEKMQLAGIATFVMRGTEYLVAIISENGILRAETMRFQDEIRSREDIGLPERTQVPTELLNRFERIIKERSKNDLSRDELNDETTAALLGIVHTKQARQGSVVHSDEGRGGGESPPDLLAELKKSLAGRGSKLTQHRTIRTGHRPRGAHARPSKSAKQGPVAHK